MNQRRRGCQPNLRTRGRSTKDVPGDYPVGCSVGVKPSPCTSGQENPQRRGADQRARRRRNELRTARPAQPRVLDAPQEPVQLAPGVKWKQGQLHERWPQRHTTSYRDPHTRGATQPPGRKKSRTRANILLEPNGLSQNGLSQNGSQHPPAAPNTDKTASQSSPATPNNDKPVPESPSSTRRE